MEYPEDLHQYIQDISVIVHKTEIYGTESTSTPEYTAYDYYYIAWLQYLYIFSLLFASGALVMFYLRITKKIK